MPNKIQSLCLQKMMQTVHRYPEYELTLPACLVKRKQLKKMHVGSVLLLGIDQLSFFLMQNEKVYALLLAEGISDGLRLSIVEVKEEVLKWDNSKKYELLIPCLGKLQCSKLEVGHKIEIPYFESTKISLFLGDEESFEGALVVVEDQLAIEITEVKNA